MTIPNSYNNIILAVQELAEDDSLEFQNYIPTAIFVAEQRLRKDLDNIFLTRNVVVNGTAGNAFVQKPSNFLVVLDLVYENDGTVYPLDRKSKSYIRDYWPVSASTGDPKYYADYDTSNFIVAPTPVSAVDFILNYQAYPNPLNSLNQTNEFTTYAPAALFYAVMSAMSEFMKDYQTQQIWEAKYSIEIATLQNQARRERRAEGFPQTNPVPQLNTLKGDN
jgi:hypothetical protein